MKYIHNNVVLLLKKQTKKTKTNIKQKVKTNSIFHDLRIIITNFKRVEEVFFLFFFDKLYTSQNVRQSAIYNACILFCDCLKITKQIAQKTHKYKYKHHTMTAITKRNHFPI